VREELTRTPSGSKEEDVEADECDLGSDSGCCRSRPDDQVTPTIPTMNSQTTIPKAPQIRIERRPNFSMIQKEIGVEQTFTRVVTRLIKKGCLMVPSSWKKVVPK
jgi:hypothetical protein